MWKARPVGIAIAACSLPARVFATRAMSSAGDKAIALRFLTPEGAADVPHLRAIMRADYIEHDAAAGDGREGPIAGQKPARAAGRPLGPHNAPIRLIAKCDDVWVRPRVQDRKRARLDQFRIRDGQFAERLRLYDDVPVARANGNDMFGSAAAA